MFWGKNGHTLIRIGPHIRASIVPRAREIDKCQSVRQLVNDRIFPVELTEIADWRSMSEYMLHLNFGKTLTRVIGGNFGAYTFKLPLP